MNNIFTQRLYSENIVDVINVLIDNNSSTLSKICTGSDKRLTDVVRKAYQMNLRMLPAGRYTRNQIRPILSSFSKVKEMINYAYVDVTDLFSGSNNKVISSDFIAMTSLFKVYQLNTVGTGVSIFLRPLFDDMKVDEHPSYWFLNKDLVSKSIMNVLRKKKEEGSFFERLMLRGYDDL